MPDIDAAMTNATAMMIDAAGKTATYTAQGGIPATITVLFTNEARNIDLGMGTVSGTDPRVLAKTEDVPDAKKGDSFTIDAVSYAVTEVNPDGTGGTEMIFKKAP